jgi:hypothetical protein
MIRDLRIEPILNGFIVQAGCQRLAYTSVDELITDIGSYLREPEATEKRILKDKGFNRKHTMEMRMPEPGPAQEANSLANYAATPNQLTELPQRAN